MLFGTFIYCFIIFLMLTFKKLTGLIEPYYITVVIAHLIYFSGIVMIENNKCEEFFHSLKITAVA